MQTPSKFSSGKHQLAVGGTVQYQVAQNEHVCENTKTVSGFSSVDWPADRTLCSTVEEEEVKKFGIVLTQKMIPWYIQFFDPIIDVVESNPTTWLPSFDTALLSLPCLLPLALCYSPLYVCMPQQHYIDTPITNIRAAY